MDSNGVPKSGTNNSVTIPINSSNSTVPPTLPSIQNNNGTITNNIISSSSSPSSSSTVHRHPYHGIVYKVPIRDASFNDCDLPLSTLDKAESLLDYTVIPRLLTTEQKRIHVATSPSAATHVYQKGPHTLAFSHSKRLTLACAIGTILFTIISLEFICYFRGFCFAGETTGSDGGVFRPVYSIASSRSIVPIGLILALICAPSALLAAHLQIMILCLLSFALNATACGLFVIAGIGTFALLGTMDETTTEIWNTLPFTVRYTGYGNISNNLLEEMNQDATTIGIVCLAGAAITGLVAVCLFPMASTQFYAFVKNYRTSNWRILCCTVTSLSYIHDGAFIAQGDTCKYVMDGIGAFADRMCPAFAARCRASWQRSAATLQQTQQTLSNANRFPVVPWNICSMTTTEAKVACTANLIAWCGPVTGNSLARCFGIVPPPTAVTTGGTSTAPATTIVVGR